MTVEQWWRRAAAIVIIHSREVLDILRHCWIPSQHHSHNMVTTLTQHITFIQHLYNNYTTFIQHYIQHLYNIYTTSIQHLYNIYTTLSEAGMIILAKIFLKEGNIFFMCTVPELIFSIFSPVGE